MKLNIQPRLEGQKIPKKGMFEWRTLADPAWDSKKTILFDIASDNKWHTYNVTLADAQYWQGDVYDLRVHPIYSDGRDGDEFFIRAIQVRSISKFSCDKKDCEYYQAGKYTHPCAGIGVAGYCLSSNNHTTKFTIENVNDSELLVDIDFYGTERIILGAFNGHSGSKIARLIERQLSLISIGGYESAQVEFTEDNRFKIHSGSFGTDSNVTVAYSKAAVTLGFYDEDGNKTFTSSIGKPPANYSKPAASYTLSTYNIQALFDNNNATSINFNPFSYNVEAGRRDWLSAGPGKSNEQLRFTMDDDFRKHTYPEYNYVVGFDQTLIDYCHPFNANGRIHEVHALGTLDIRYEKVPDPRFGGWLCTEEDDIGRVTAIGSKFLIFRPKADGTLICVNEVPIRDKDKPNEHLYDRYQMVIEEDCNLFVKKGDLLGIYNVKLYKGPLSDPHHVNALYYVFPDKVDVGDVIYPGSLHGDGTDGLMMYARSNQKQSRLLLDVDLGNRLNVENISIVGEPESPNLEYNLARCLDINWTCDVFGGWHTVGFFNNFTGFWEWYTVDNLYYGVDKLYDGITTVPKNGTAADGWSSYSNTGVIPVNPQYFWVNGDHEWLGRHYFEYPWYTKETVKEFEQDPIAFTIKFPLNRNKKIFKSKIYFKEENNFKNFALSYYVDDFYLSGDADNPHFNLIPDYTAVTLDKIRYVKHDRNYSQVDVYLFSNPSIGHMNLEYVNGPGLYYPGDATLPGHASYFANFKITNSTSTHQAANLEWKTITHEWEPLDAKGFRVYTNYHRSTKILEMEIYGFAPDTGSSLVGGMFINYSLYGTYWINSDLYQEGETRVVAPVGDTPRYFTIDINPILPTRFSDIILNVSMDDVFVEDNSCENIVLLENNGLDATGETKEIVLKNYYGVPYDLYVDILRTTSDNLSTVFYNKFNGYDSLKRSDRGPRVNLSKSYDYPIKNDNYNVSINCDCYALKDSIIGKLAYYTYDDGNIWKEFNNGERLTDNLIQFQNITKGVYSVIHIPVLSRNRYWRIALLCKDNNWKIREIRAYYEGVELDALYYHDKDIDLIYGAAVDTAPHLNNKSVSGSYYEIKDRQYITLDLGSPKSIDKLVIYHDYKRDSVDYVSNSTTELNTYCGVDRYTTCYLLEDKFNDTIFDYSYYENDVIKHGNIEIDSSITTVSGSYKADFSSPVSVAEWEAVEWWNGNTRYYVLQHLTYFDWVPPSGTVVSGTYEYPGYLDFSIEGYNTTGFYSSIRRSVDEEKEFYWGVRVINSQNAPQIELKFVLEVNDFQSGSVNVGFLDGSKLGHSYAEYLWGCHVEIRFDGTYIYVVTDSVFQGKYNSPNFGTCQLDTKYYFKMTYDGISLYTLSVWEDDFDGDVLAFTGNWTDTHIWSSEYIGIASARNHTYPDNYVKGKLYHFEINTNLSSDGIVMPGSTGSIKFDGDSYITVPKIEAFRIEQRWASIDFWLKPTELPRALRDVSSKDHQIEYKGLELFKPSEGYVGWAYQLKDPDSFIIVRDKSYFDFRYDDFTIDLYCKFMLFGSAKMTLFYRKDTLHLYYDGVESKLVFESGDVLLTSSHWYDPVRDGYVHIAVSRAGNDIYLFLNGNIEDSTVISGTLGYYEDTDTCWAKWSSGFNKNDMYIGMASVDDSVTDPFLGIIEEARITKGFARWSSPFTPPTSKFVPDEYTILLVRGQRNYSVVLQQRKTDLEDHLSDPDNQFALVLSKSTSYSNKYTLEILYNDNAAINKALHLSIFRPNRWTHVTFVIRGRYSKTRIAVDGLYASLDYGGTPNITGLSDLEIGKYFKGNITNLRISRGDRNNPRGKSRYYDKDYNYRYIPIPTKMLFGRLYTMSFYVSDTNEIYGKYCDVDMRYESQYSYYFPGSLFSYKYFSMFAVDLEKRYSLEFLRNYASPNATDLSLYNNALYSNADTSNVNEAFKHISSEELDTSFVAQDYSIPKLWNREETSVSHVYIFDNKMYMKVNGASSYEDTAKSLFKYGFMLDFDIQFDYILSDRQDNTSWSLVLVLQDPLNSRITVTFEIGFISGRIIFRIAISDDEDNISERYFTPITVFVPIKGSMKVKRVGSVVTFYTKDIDKSVWSLIYEYRFIYNEWTRTSLSFILKSVAPGYPLASVYIDNFIINVGKMYYNDPKDARWVMVTLLNGDGTNRLLERFNIFTEVSTQLAPGGGYNNDWEPLGSSITAYASGNKNVAFGAMVSGTKTFGVMDSQYLVDGEALYDMSKCWGVSGDIPEPYFVLDLGKVYDVYRFVLKHGAQEYNDQGARDDHMIYDYTIAVAEEQDNFTTVFNITDNDSYERTHDLMSSVKARWVKVQVFDFAKSQTQMPIGDGTYGFFDGPALREIEVYENYGFSIINSDDTPIIALNLKYQFYISNTPNGVGPWAEDDTKDWTHDPTNYTYSDSVVDEPEKVLFGKWGDTPNYERWVVSKDLNATNHNAGKKYLKYLKVFGNEKPNIIEYPEWWGSNKSILSSSYAHTYYTCTRALRIEYPKSSVNERIYFREGDDFGIDEKCSWRDAMAFRWYIEDYDAIDWTYGEFYFGGLDGTSRKQPVIYHWDFTSLSGSVQSGWNNMFLRFKSADHLDYNASEGVIDTDPRTPNEILFGTFGFFFRGNDTKNVIFEIDGLLISRNIFEDKVNDVPGLYLSENDSVTMPFSNINLSAGAVSMWIRPDTTIRGIDSYGKTASRSIFNLTSTANDSFGCIITSVGFLIYYGNTLTGTFNRLFLNAINDSVIRIDEPWHFGIAFSNNGKGIDSSGATIKLFINGVLSFTYRETWTYEDDKFYTFIFGGTGSANATFDLPGEAKSISAVISEVKIYNYAKTDFYKDMFVYDKTDYDYEVASSSDLIEISKDNVTFYKIDDPHLPFFYEKVPNGDSVTVYSRTVLPNKISNAVSRTARLLAQWDIGV